MRNQSIWLKNLRSRQYLPFSLHANLSHSNFCLQFSAKNDIYLKNKTKLNNQFSILKTGYKINHSQNSCNCKDEIYPASWNCHQKLSADEIMSLSSLKPLSRSLLSQNKNHKSLMWSVPHYLKLSFLLTKEPVNRHSCSFSKAGSFGAQHSQRQPESQLPL